MKNIFEILKDNGIEFDEGKKETINKAVAENYKTINEFTRTTEKLQKELEEKTTSINDLNKKISGMTDTSELDSLKTKVKQYEDAENARKADAEKQKAYEADKQRFDKLKGEKEYYNEGTERWIFDDFSGHLLMLHFLRQRIRKETECQGCSHNHPC